MNGIGKRNRRGRFCATKPAAVTAEEARRAVASPARPWPYDQLMVLQPPRLSGTEAFIRIYNNDGSEAGALRQTAWRCVVRRHVREDRPGPPSPLRPEPAC